MSRTSRRKCPRCQTLQGVDKGRTMNGKRAYRCTTCRYDWSEGWQGRRTPRYSPQRPGNQFADTGAAAGERRGLHE